MALVTVTYTMEDTVLARYVNTVCKVRGYKAVLPDGTPNPETRMKFTKRMRILDDKSYLEQAEAMEAADAARAVKLAEIEAIEIT